MGNSEQLLIIGKTGRRQVLGKVYQTEFLTSEGTKFLDEDSLNTANLSRVRGIDWSRSKHTYKFYLTYASPKGGYQLCFLDDQMKEVFIKSFSTIKLAVELAEGLGISKIPIYLKNSLHN